MMTRPALRAALFASAALAFAALAARASAQAPGTPGGPPGRATVVVRATDAAPHATAPAGPERATVPAAGPPPQDAPFQSLQQLTPGPPGSLTPPAATGMPTRPQAPSPAVPTDQTGPVDLLRPILRVEDSHVDPSPAAPGQEVRVRLEVENVGQRTAEHVQLSFGGGVLVPVGRGGALYKEEIDPGETRPFDLELRVDSAAATGTYPLSLTLRWEDETGGSYSEATTLAVQVVAPGKSRPIITVAGARVPGRVAAGVPFAVTLTLVNGGSAEARNVSVVPGQGTLGLAGGETPPVNIAPGAGAPVTVRLVAGSGTQPGAVSQGLEIRYDDPDGQRLTETTTIGLSIAGDAVAAPQPMVLSYEITGRNVRDDVLHPGDVFDLRLQIANVGQVDALDARMALGGGAGGAPVEGGAGGAGSASLGAFAPLDTSNLRFLGRLAVGEERSVVQRMVVDGAAKPGVHTITVEFRYADADGQAAASSEVIGLRVSRRIALEVNPVSVVTGTVAGEVVPFSVEVVNAGISQVSVGNAEVTAGPVEAGGPVVLVTDGTIFLGPLDSGAVFPVEATLAPQGPGKAEVHVTVHYTDDFGQPQVYRETFPLEIDAAPTAPTDLVIEPVTDDRLLPRLVRGLLGLGASPRSRTPPGSIGEPAIGPPEGAIRIKEGSSEAAPPPVRAVPIRRR